MWNSTDLYRPCTWFILLAATAVGRADDATSHPLDPLNPAELAEAVELIQEQVGGAEHILLPQLALQEPTKAELDRYNHGASLARRALAVVVDRRDYLVHEAVIDLTARRIISWKRLPGMKSVATYTETAAAEEIVKSHEGWQQALRARGIDNLDHVFISAWASGEALSEHVSQTRLFRVIAYYFENGETNPYGRPIDGVMALVDLNRGEVTQLITSENVGFPQERADFFDPDVRGPDRPALKSLTIEQPEGPDFTVEGHLIRWENWRFRYALHPREGLVLYEVGYQDGDTVRPILHRASLSEMVVPYGDPDQTWHWRAAFDQGEYGLGWLAGPLVKGADVPMNAVLLPAVFADEFGDLDVREDVVAVYEQDAGILWKHLDDVTFARSETRRARNLVISYMATVGNYDYGLNWVFRQDGSIQVRVNLTGILLAKGVSADKCAICQEIDRLPRSIEQATTVTPGGDQRYGTLVGRQVVATNHQHIFNFRLDFAVDGPDNSFSELNVLPSTASNNLAGNAFIQEETLFAVEREARRSINLEQHRTWKVFNPNHRNALGHHTSYALLPGDNSVPYLRPGAPLRKRAAFMDHHVWVTKQHPEELHAAGDYPCQNPDTIGLPEWSGDESIVNEDLVLWYTLSVTHIPRPEEWPIMSTAEVGFNLVPMGFFSRNPALDVPN